MAITIGTNIPSYSTRINLNNVTDDLSTTMERLSSGLKINRAGDDAAGLVISENMEAVIRASEQAMKNIQTASSFLSVTEDGMVSISEHYQRINDLLENMANDTNDIQSRTAAVEEIIERLDEIDRLADTTDFSGRKMLNGVTDEIIVQMGSDSTELSTLDISPALSNCHTSAGAMKTYLAPNLHPKARKNAAGDIIAPDKKGNWYDKDGNIVLTMGDDGVLRDSTGTEVTEADLDANYGKAGTGFEPNNENCRKYMATIQNAIADIAERRGLIGAYENRMESSYDSLTTRIASLKSAKMVYTDVDIAETASNFTTQQVMQQINISILGTANGMQQNALALLGG